MAQHQFDRAMGCLLGGAIGDALGMPSQILSPGEIRKLYGRIQDFVEPLPDHPVSRGLPAGSITDDTEQTLLLAEVLQLSPYGFDDRLWAGKLMAWEDSIRERGGHDLLGPSTKRALASIADGIVPEEAGRFGDTNGAAMRIAPVGIAFNCWPMSAFVARVHETCKATHNTSIAIGGAAAVGAVVSVAIEGLSWEAAKSAALEAATIGQSKGYWIAGPDIAARIGWALELVKGRNTGEAIDLVIQLIGTSVATQESVPAAFAVLEIARGDAWEAAVISANLGGDTDTIGAIAAGMAGALSGASALPADKLRMLRGFDLAQVEKLARGLLALRASAAMVVA